LLLEYGRFEMKTSNVREKQSKILAFIKLKFGKLDKSFLDLLNKVLSISNETTDLAILHSALVRLPSPVPAS
jgi:hypothetical protein